MGWFFLSNGQIKKKSQNLFCVFSYAKCLPRVSTMACSSSRQSSAALLHSSFTFNVQYRQMSQDFARADRRRGVNIFGSMSTIWAEALLARASICVQGHEHRHRQSGPGVLRQETPANWHFRPYISCHSETALSLRYSY